MILDLQYESLLRNRSAERLYLYDDFKKGEITEMKHVGSRSGGLFTKYYTFRLMNNNFDP
jgi:hypothetical protein